MNQKINADEMLDFLIDFCRVNTINGIKGCENNGSQFLYNRLKELNYFKENPENLFLQAVDGDYLNRNNTVAFLEAATPTKKVIILSGHIDTVDTEVCGAYKDFAFDPYKYTEEIRKADLKTDIIDDLNSGQFLAGRGMADMKSGLAAQWSVLKYFAENREELNANLLWIPVIDEENNANGIRQAVDYFCELQDDGYEFLCCVDSEPTITPERKDCGRIYLGTIGMVTPFVLAVGKESHVGEYYEGISASFMAFNIGTQIEANPSFTDEFKGKDYPPICCLKTTDFRKNYSVTVPNRFGMYYNYLFVKKSPTEILNLFEEVVEDALNTALMQINKGHLKTNIIRFDVLTTMFEDKTGASADTLLKSWVVDKADEMDIQDGCLNAVNDMCDALDLEAPTVVIGFLPPYCPSRVNNRESAAEIKLEQVVRNLVQKNSQEGTMIEISEVYEGISDLSELGFQGTEEDIQILKSNMVGVRIGTAYNFEKMQQLDIPVVNIGPIGKDAHKISERLYLPYFKEKLPQLLLDFIYDMQK